MELVLGYSIGNKIIGKYGDNAIKKIYDRINYHSLTEKLRVVRKVREMIVSGYYLGRERLTQYKKNELELSEDKYFVDSQSYHNKKRVLNFLIGYEFNIYLVKLLKKISAINIQPEDDINFTRIAVIADIKKLIVISVISNKNRIVLEFLKLETHAFEAKAQKGLKDLKVVRQLNVLKKPLDTRMFFCFA